MHRYAERLTGWYIRTVGSDCQNATYMTCAHEIFHSTARIVILSPNIQKCTILTSFCSTEIRGSGIGENGRDCNH